jgi:hypothetical protein
LKTDTPSSTEVTIAENPEIPAMGTEEDVMITPSLPKSDGDPPIL